MKESKVVGCESDCTWRKNSTLKHSDEILKAFERTIEKDTDPKKSKIAKPKNQSSTKFRCLFYSYYRS